MYRPGGWFNYQGRERVGDKLPVTCLHHRVPAWRVASAPVAGAPSPSRADDGGDCDEMKILLFDSVPPPFMHIPALLSAALRVKGHLVLDWQSFGLPDAAFGLILKQARNSDSLAGDLHSGQSDPNRPLVVVIENGTSLEDCNLRVDGFVSSEVEVIYFDRSDPGPALARISEVLERRRRDDQHERWQVLCGLALVSIYLCCTNL